MGGRMVRARYAWELANTVAYEGYTLYVLRLTSQTWLTTAEVDVTVWERTTSRLSGGRRDTGTDAHQSRFRGSRVRRCFGLTGMAV